MPRLLSALVALSLCLLSPPAKAAPSQPIGPPSATADTHTLVLLKDGIPLQHPLLKAATPFATPNHLLAILTEEEVVRAQEAKLIQRSFEGDPMEGELWLIRVEGPEQYPGAPYAPIWSDGDVELYRIPQEEGRELGRNGAQLIRLVPLPRFEQPVQGLEPTNIQSPSAVVDDVMAGLSEESWSFYVQSLSGEVPVEVDGGIYTLDTRHTEHPDNTVAGDYLVGELEALGYEVSTQSFLLNGQLERNIVARKSGTVRPNEVYVLGAHYDSRSDDLTDIGSPAPGADDNASGTAVILEIARALAPYSLSSSLELVLFGAEEQGLVGSSEYVTLAGQTGKQLKGAIIFDMVSYWSDTYSVIIEGTPQYFRWMRNASRAARTYADLSSELHFFSFGSDHVPFQSAGIPTYLLIEKDWDAYPEYHTSNDVLANCDPHMAIQIARIAVAAMSNAIVISKD